MSAPYIQFGSGLLYLNPNAGNLATNPTPVRPFTLQDIKIGLKGKIEALRGQYQFPDDTATGDKDGSFEFSIGRRDFFMLNNIFNSDTVTTGGVSAATSVQTIAASITITPPASGTFGEDLGVVLTSNNKEFTKVTTGPSAGQYTVSAGVYTFNSTDVANGGSVSIAYTYTQSTIGSTYQVNNQVQGWGPAFEAFILDTYQPIMSSGVPVYSCVRLYAAKISDVEIDNKRSGYGMLSLKGAFFTSSSGRVIDFYSNV